MEDHEESVEVSGAWRHLDALIMRHPRLETVRTEIARAFEVLRGVVESGGTLYLCGNGGSAADAEHFAAELLKGFEHPRPLFAHERDGLSARLADGLQRGIRAVPLTGFIGARTAIANDTDATLEFAQLVFTLAREGDALVGFSTSGRSANVVHAAEAAAARGARVIALAGAGGGPLAELADCAIRVPVSRTLEVQELHLPVYHTLALMLEEALVGASRGGAGRVGSAERDG